MYEVLVNLGYKSDASEYLENAYFELKARSKNIKDKKIEINFYRLITYNHSIRVERKIKYTC